jgi:hypothetical protein
MRKAIDLMGGRFGKLVALECVGSAHRQRLWRCACECGREAVVAASNLRGGNTKSCGCFSPAVILDQRFGMLRVLECVGAGCGSRRWRCACDCGKQTVVTGSNLLSGHTRSCGCLVAITTRLRSTTHGRTQAPEHYIWSTMRQRCSNPRIPSYRNYGARGIKVSPRWESFENFLTDMGPRPSPHHSIERIDNDGPYSPTNCAWIPRREQQLNTRRTRWITYNGRTQPITVWAIESGIGRSTIKERLKRGWTLERALTQPVDVRFGPRRSTEGAAA